jgi:AraC family transcriptional regulator
MEDQSATHDRRPSEIITSDRSESYRERTFSKCHLLDRLSGAMASPDVEAGKSSRGGEDDTRFSPAEQVFDIPSHYPAHEPHRRVAVPLQKWRLKRVMEFVEGHIGEPISLPALAGAAGMSRMYFASQFRAATGVRPHDYVLQRRIEAAKRLLMTTQEPIVAIALSVGFQTQAHFTTIFKKLAGDTPLKWRRAHQH